MKLSAYLCSRRQSNRNGKSASIPLPCELESRKTESASSSLPCRPPPRAPDNCNTKSMSLSAPCIPPIQVPERRSPTYDLLLLIIRKNWNDAIAHCQDHPQDAQCGSWGRCGFSSPSPLYEAYILNAPVEVIRAVIQANPEVLEQPSWDRGELPLHEICKSRSTSVAVFQEFLIRPATACHKDRRAKDGRAGLTPLMRLWLTRNSYGQPRTPVQQHQFKMFDVKAELLVDAIAICRKKFWYAHGKDIPQDYTGMGVDNNISNLPGELYKIHALVSMGPLGFPLPVLELICDKYPQQLQTRDDSGLLPLHLSVGFSNWSPVLFDFCMQRIIHILLNSVIHILLNRNREAARTPLLSTWDSHNTKTNDHMTARILDSINGRYPLHIALSNHYEWEGGVRELVQAAPEVLSVRDPVTKLYPFQLAALPSQGRLVSIDTIFELLINSPELVLDVSSCWC